MPSWDQIFPDLYALASLRGKTAQQFNDYIDAWVLAGGYPGESARLFLAATEWIDVDGAMLSDMLQRHRHHAKELELIIRRKCGLLPLA